MNALKEFTIPIYGLAIGSHLFHFDIDSEFFTHFENSQIDKGNFKVNLVLDKRSDLIILSFHIAGSIDVECDRCLMEIDLAIEIEEEQILKFSEEENFEEEVHFILVDRHELNVARYIFEFIHLNIPLVRRRDCEESNYKDCDKEVLKYLIDDTEEEEKIENQNPFKIALKDLDIEKK